MRIRINVSSLRQAFFPDYNYIRICRSLSTAHTSPFLYKNSDKNIDFVRSHYSSGGKISVSVVLILSQCCVRDKFPFLCVHTDILRSRRTSVSVNIHFDWCVCKLVFFVRSSVNDFTKTEV